MTRAGRVSFAGCDLLSLSKDPRVLRAAARALRRDGASASASRTTTGTLPVHVALERELARFFGTQDAVCLPAGWLAPQALVRALAPRADTVLLDDGAHPALVDAATLSGLPVKRYAHFDPGAAGRAARGAGRVLLVTDGVDPSQGRIAPLRALAQVARRSGGQLVVDEAHAAGVLGRRGRGAAELADASGAQVHVAGSLSKAFGAQGGFVVGSRALCDAVRAQTVYAGATPLAPAVAAAAREAVRIARREPELRARLAKNAARMRRAFRRLGLETPADRVPWFGIAGRQDLARVSRLLAKQGFVVPHIRYFGGPEGGQLKVAVSAKHSAAEIGALERELAAIRA